MEYPISVHTTVVVYPPLSDSQDIAVDGAEIWKEVRRSSNAETFCIKWDRVDAEGPIDAMISIQHAHSFFVDREATYIFS